VARALVIATASSVSGEAYVRNSAGKIRRLNAGDVVAEGDVVGTSEGGQVVLNWRDERGVTVVSGQPARMAADPVAALSMEAPALAPPGLEKPSPKTIRLAAAQVALPIVPEDEPSPVVGEALANDGGHAMHKVDRIAEALASDGGHNMLEIDRLSEAFGGSWFPVRFGPYVADDRIAPATGVPLQVLPLALPDAMSLYLTAGLDPSSDSGTVGDGITNDKTPTISGRSEPGAGIQVTMPGGEVLLTVASADGHWAVRPNRDLPDGPCTIAVTATDRFGQVIDTSVPLRIDSTIPNAGLAPMVQITEDANNDGFINLDSQCRRGKRRPGRCRRDLDGD
jgi:hypothetical protein